MSNKAKYKELINEYLTAGGPQAFVDALPFGYSLQNEAKIRFALRELKPKTAIKPPKKEVKTPFKDFISEYPVALHDTYLARKVTFIEACSLKIRLNALNEQQSKEAFDLQNEIIKRFDVVDKANEVLEYWREHKQILPTKSEGNIEQYSDTELVQRRNTLRSNLVNRRKTIAKMQKDLAVAPERNKLRLTDKLNKKIQEYKQIEVSIEEMDRKINTLSNEVS